MRYQRLLLAIALSLLVLVIYSPNSRDMQVSVYAYHIDAAWPAESVPVHVNFNNTVPSTWLPILRSALKTWSDAGTTLWFVEGSAPNGINVAVIPDSSIDCGGSASLGCTTTPIYPNDHTKIRASSIILAKSGLSDNKKLEAVFLHELGHAIGFKERYGSPFIPGLTPRDSVMCDYEGYCLINTTLSEDDKTQVRAKYGFGHPAPLLPPSEPSPPDASTIPAPTPNLSWNYKSEPGYFVNPEGYIVQMSAKQYPEDVLDSYIVNRKTIDRSAFVDQNLVANQKYYWRVKSYVSSGLNLWTSNWSPWWSFQIAQSQHTYDDATFASQSQYPTVNLGLPVSFYINLQNSGTSTWRANGGDGYGYHGTDEFAGNRWNLCCDISPGSTASFTFNITAPQQPGKYRYGMRLTHNNQDFGPYAFIEVTVNNPGNPSGPGGNSRPPASCQNWAIGQLVKLRKGTEIRPASSLSSPPHTILPVDDWLVGVIEGPRFSDSQWWWGISRKAAGDPSGGTGWVIQTQADYCPSPPDTGGPGSDGDSQSRDGITITDFSFNPSSGGARVGDSISVHVRAEPLDQVTAIKLSIDGQGGPEFGGPENTFNLGTGGLSAGNHTIITLARSRNANGSWENAASWSKSYTLQPGPPTATPTPWPTATATPPIIPTVVVIGTPMASATPTGNTPVLIEPARDTIRPNISVLLRWQNPVGTTQVEVRVLPYANDGPGVDLILGSAREDLAIPAPVMGSGSYILLPDMTYTWTVRSSTATQPLGVDSPQWGPWAPTITFHTPKVTSTGISPVWPTPGSSIGSGAATLQWRDTNSSVFYYEVQVSGDDRFDTDSATAMSFVWWNLVHGGVATPLNSWQTPALQPGVTYFWRVRPRVQGDGIPVDWSPTWSFTAQSGIAPSVTSTVVPPVNPTLGPAIPTPTVALGNPTVTTTVTAIPTGTGVVTPTAIPTVTTMVTATSTATSIAGAGWTRSQPQGLIPASRAAHTAAWDGEQMLVFGGYNGTYLSDLWSYSPVTNTWTSLTPLGVSPPARRDHTAVWDGTQMLVFGGYNATAYFNDLWSYHPSNNSWTQLVPAGETPAARANHSAAWDSASNQLLVFGGYRPDTLNDLWSYNPAMNRWTRLASVGPLPLPRGSHSAVWDPIRKQLLIFSGDSDVDRFNDLWSYQPSSNSWVQLRPGGVLPPAIPGHTAVWDSVNNQMVTFGGSSGSGNLNDLWSYQPTTNTWKLLAPGITPPSSRDNHSAAWDSASNQLLVFGGYNFGFLNDLWSYR